MKVIAICSQKGGVAKTTLSLNLGVTAERRGIATVLIDVDPQQSLSKLGDERPKGSVPDVISAQASRLARNLDDVRAAGAELVIIDTGPNSEIASKLAMQAANYVIIPCKPSPIDLKAIEATLDLAASAGERPKAVVLTMAPPGKSTIVPETAEVIRASGYEVSPVVIHQRQPYVYATAAGQAVIEFDARSKSAEEIDELWVWVAGKVGIDAGKSNRPEAQKATVRKAANPDSGEGVKSESQKARSSTVGKASRPRSPHTRKVA
jgi:chromosome partitioning protein